MRVTEESIRKGIEEMFGKYADITYDELKTKVLSGYAYKIDSGGGKENKRRLMLNTGKGGVLIYIESCENQGVPAFLCADSITVFTDKGPAKLSEVNIKKIKDANR